MPIMKKANTPFQVAIVALFFITFFATNQTTAQDAGYFNHQFIQPILINPAAAGFQGDHNVLAAYRRQWSDFPDAPRTFTGLYHGAVADRMGLGIQLMTDRAGAGQLFLGKISYAYQFQLENVNLSLGLSAGMQQFKAVDFLDDPLVDPTDVLLAEAADGLWIFDGGVGLYGEADDKLFFGVSFPNLIKNRITDIQGDINLPDFNEFSYAVLVGYRFNVTNYNFTVEPSLTIKDFRYSPFLVDANVKFSFLDEQLVGGLGYTLGDNSRASLLLGTRIDKLRLYYSYDVSLGDFQRYNNGSHEITLVYRIPARSEPSSTEE